MCRKYHRQPKRGIKLQIRKKFILLALHDIRKKLSNVRFMGFNDKMRFYSPEKNKLASFTFPVEDLTNSNKFVQTDISQSTKRCFLGCSENST